MWFAVRILIQEDVIEHHTEVRHALRSWRRLPKSGQANLNASVPDPECETDPCYEHRAHEGLSDIGSYLLSDPGPGFRELAVSHQWQGILVIGFEGKNETPV